MKKLIMAGLLLVSASPALSAWVFNPLIIGQRYEVRFFSPDGSTCNEEKFRVNILNTANRPNIVKIQYLNGAKKDQIEEKPEKAFCVVNFIP